MSAVSRSVEGSFQIALGKVLPRLIEKLGVEVEVYRDDTTDPYTVYGIEPPLSRMRRILSGKVMFVSGTDFTSHSPKFAGELDEVRFYSFLVLMPGDVVEVVRGDNASRRYRVTLQEAAGTMFSVVTRFVAKPFID